MILVVFEFSDRVSDWAINTPPGQGFTGIGLILTGAGMAKLIVTAKPDPRATLAGKLVGLCIAALLGALGLAFVVAAITHEPAPSTF